ncbi:MAG TPA: hypothetical protein VK805_12945 [Candidatus Baltobacteraceae bacterium]|jgi:chromosome segregation ATPase|nr:hypothetical protein [Candidatus Baltobacteraceae bacterium]
MSTGPKVYETDGQNFSALHQAGITKSLALDLPDPRLTVLSKLRMNWNPRDEKTISVLNELLFSRDEENKKIDKLFRKWQSDILCDREAEHEQAKAAVVQQLERIEQAKGEIDHLQNQINDLAQDVFSRESALTAARERLHGLSPYSPKAAVQKAEESLRVAEARLEEIQSRSASIESQQRHIALVEIPALNEQLRKLTSDERRAAAAITGESYVDESGLILPGGSTF